MEPKSGSERFIGVRSGRHMSRSRLLCGGDERLCHTCGSNGEGRGEPQGPEEERRHSRGDGDDGAAEEQDGDVDTTEGQSACGSLVADQRRSVGRRQADHIGGLGRGELRALGDCLRRERDEQEGAGEEREAEGARHHGRPFPGRWRV